MSRTKKLLIGDDELRKLLRENEPEANMAIAQLMFIIACGYLVLWLMFQFRLFKAEMELVNAILLGSYALVMLSVIACFLNGGKKRWIKYSLTGSIIISVFGINCLIGYKAWLMYALPLLLTCRYYDTKLTFFTNLIASALTLVSAFGNVFVSPQTGVLDMNMVAYRQDTVLYVDQTLYHAVSQSEIDQLLTLRNTLLLSTVPTIVILSVLTFGCMQIIRHSLKMMHEIRQITQQKADIESELDKTRTRVILSQIQPHFLYNSLSSIMAIEGNPDETVDAIAEFGKYLRENLDTLSRGDMVPFSKEMQHVMRYVSLEMLRFKDKVTVTYDLGVKAFSIPALTVQMLVENAIKHGITQKATGGNVRITSCETEGEYLIRVEDDGIGFDVHSLPSDDTRSHIGLSNIRSRLETLCGGSLEISSKPGEGTIATVHIPKGGNDS